MYAATYLPEWLFAPRAGMRRLLEGEATAGGRTTGGRTTGGRTAPG